MYFNTRAPISRHSFFVRSDDYNASLNGAMLPSFEMWLSSEARNGKELSLDRLTSLRSLMGGGW